MLRKVPSNQFFPGLLLAMSLASPPVEDIQATSLLGRPLSAPEIPGEEKLKMEQNLAKAKSDLEKDAESADAMIWVGRRTAYLGRYQEAIAIYTEAIQKYPSNPKLYRHRGHRYLTVREINKAIADFEKAAQLIEWIPDEIEPDGIPNAKNIPTSTLKFNIWYHLGLANYIRGDFQNALHAYQKCMTFSTNDDMKVATSYWLYLTLKRLKKDPEAEQTAAKINKNMDIIEDFEYHDLMLMFRGEKEPGSLMDPTSKESLSQATVGYGVAMWYQLNGNPEMAEQIFQKILESDQWPSFGYLAAEAELARQSSEL